MLSIPLKTCDLTTDWMESIHRLTSTSFGEACAKACMESASALRLAQKLAAKAKLSTDNEASQAVEALLSYYHILLRLEAPLGADARDRKVLSIQWRSAWDDAAKFKHHELGLEIAAVLFNLAAAFSARGALAQGADDVESVKAAARDFQLAAGALAEVESLSPHANFGAACTDDLSDGCLVALRELMLAQAQACVCTKAEADGMGGALRCKLMVGASKAYGRAAAALEALGLAGGRLEKLGGKRPGADFAAVAAARGSYYEAGARWQAAQEAAEAGKHGLQQAQLQLAAAAAAAAAAGQASVPEPGKGKAVALQARVLEQLARVRSDNELIYYEAVPPEGSLDPIDPKMFVKPQPLAPLLAPIDGQRVPPQLLSRGEGDELLMSELFQPLREWPRDVSAALAARLAAEEQGVSSDEEAAPEAAPSAVSFLRGRVAKAAISSAVSSEPDSPKVKPKDKDKDKGKAASDVPERPGGFSLGSLFRAKETAAARADAKPAASLSAAAAATAEEEQRREEEALQAAITASLEDNGGSGSSGGGGSGGSGGGGGSATSISTNEERISRLLRGKMGGSSSGGSSAAPPPSSSAGGPPTGGDGEDEDEQLRRALAASLQDQGPPLPPPPFDAALRMPPPPSFDAALRMPPPPAPFTGPPPHAPPPPPPPYGWGA